MAFVHLLHGFAVIVIDFVTLDLTPLCFLSAVEQNGEQSGPCHDKAESDGFGYAEEEGLDDISKAESGLTEKISGKIGDDRKQ